MNSHHNKLSVCLLTLSILVTFACNFVANKIPNAQNQIDPTETVPLVKVTATPRPVLSPNSTPMPNGLILKSKEDTNRLFNGFQVTFLEDQADGFLPENQNEIDMYFGESHDFTIHLESGQKPLAWATGWCASGDERLSENLGKIQFEMSVDGQNVDLNQVFKIDHAASFHTAGNICSMYIIMVYDWPLGTTTLTSKTILKEPVNDGVKDYEAGELTRTYHVINSGGARPFPNSPFLGSVEETQNAINAGFEALEQAADEKLTSEQKIGETRNFTVHVIDPNRHLIWVNGWCAKDNNILNQNLQNIDFELYVNGQQINLDKVLSRFYKYSKGGDCFAYDIVMYGWPSGAITITKKLVITNPINDGFSDYKTGELTTIYTVINP